MALSDVLILLDCCSSGVANASEGNGITELICACPFDTEANGVGHYCFTRALITELRLLSKKPCFSVGQLYTSIYTRIQSHLKQGIENERYPPPVHFVLTPDEPFIRGGIMLSVLKIKLSDQDNAERGRLKRVRFEEPYVSNAIEESTAPHHTSKRYRLDESPGSRMEDIILPWIDASGAYQPQDPSIAPSAPSQESNDCLSVEGPHQAKQPSEDCRKHIARDSLYPLDAPRALFAVRFRRDMRGQDLSIELFREWLRSIPAAAEEVCVEAGFKCFSTLLLITIPLSMWSYMPQHPAIFALGAVRSSIMLPPKRRSKKSCRDEASKLSYSLSKGVERERDVGQFTACDDTFKERAYYSREESDVGIEPQFRKNQDEFTENPSPSTSIPNFEVSEPATIYVRNILDKFPSADMRLIQRLGECNWQRYVMIRKAKEGSEIDREHLPDATGSILQPVSLFHDSGLGSSRLANSCYAASVSSFISRAGDVDGEFFRVPPTPKEVVDGKPFECFICGRTMHHIRTRVEWK